MLNTIAFVIAGGFLLYKGAEWLVGSAARVAKHFRISRIIIGLTIIAVGTSLPELVTSLMAAFGGAPDLALGNVLGSNVANIGLVLAIAVIIKPLKSHVDDLYRDAPWLVLGSVFLLILSLDGILSRLDGLVFIFFSGIFYYYIISHVRKARMEEEELPFHEFKLTSRDRTKNYLLIILGMATLILGAQMLLAGALEAARIFSVPELLIGITLVALGTSLPELAASAWSAIHGHADVTLGNVVGSNVANIFLVLGIVIIFTPIHVSQHAINLDIPFLIVYTFLTIFLIRTRNRLSRWEGILLLLIYIIYITWSFFN